MMSKRTEVGILVVLACVFGFAFLSICDQTVVPLLAKGSGPGGVTVAPSGWLQLIITGLGAGGFSLASVVVVLKNLASLIPASNPFHAVVAPAIDASQILLYQQAYKNAKSQAEKDQIRAAAKLPGIIAADRANAGYDQPEAIEVATHLPAIKIRVADNPAPTKTIADKPEYYRVGQRVAEPLFEPSIIEEPTKTTMTIEEKQAKIEATKQALREKYGD